MNFSNLTPEQFDELAELETGVLAGRPLKMSSFMVGRAVRSKSLRK